MILGTLGFILALTGKTPAILIGFIIVVTWSAIQDQIVLKRVGRWKFWVFTIAITLLAGILLGANPQNYYGIPFSYDGLYAGLLMNLRAFTLVVATVLLAKSITRNSFFKTSSILGIPNLTPAFSSAMSTLPKVNDAWNEANKKAGGSRYIALAHLLNWITDLARGFSENSGRVFVVTGKRGAGKTSYIHNLANKLELEGYTTAGIFQKRRVDAEGVTNGYVACRLNHEEEIEIAYGRSGKGFEFSDEGFSTAGDWLIQDSREANVVFIDEMGLLEANGRGYAPVFATLLEKGNDKTYVLTLRKDKQNALSAMFDLKKSNFIDLDRGQEQKSFYQKLISTF